MIENAEAQFNKGRQKIQSLQEELFEKGYKKYDSNDTMKVISEFVKGQENLKGLME